jgi:hypothetical protein
MGIILSTAHMNYGQNPGPKLVEQDNKAQISPRKLHLISSKIFFWCTVQI